MKCFPILLTVLLTIAAPALACTEDGRPNSVKLELMPAAPLEAGKTVQVTAKLSGVKGGKPITLADLKQVHTQKLHLLVVDPALADYHHLHPIAGTKPGEYTFDFTPNNNDRYRVFADVTLAKSGRHEYVMADMGTPAETPVAMDKTPSMVTTVDGYTFTLTLEDPLKAGEAAMATITVTKDGKPFAGLQPVMGAFAHMVGFGEDHASVLHIHPLGEEPKTDAARGGPTLMFHIEPHHAGFVKLFAQVRIDGHDIFAPFGVVVKK